tara:strand:+ start:2381 stop:2596 length:216 start_codon:yes stop_codon:yes gene_type:complete
MTDEPYFRRRIRERLAESMCDLAEGPPWGAGPCICRKQGDRGADHCISQELEGSWKDWVADEMKKRYGFYI